MFPPIGQPSPPYPTLRSGDANTALHPAQAGSASGSGASSNGNARESNLTGSVFEAPLRWFDQKTAGRRTPDGRLAAPRTPLVDTSIGRRYQALAAQAPGPTAAATTAASSTVTPLTAEIGTVLPVKAKRLDPSDPLVAGDPERSAGETSWVTSLTAVLPRMRLGYGYGPLYFGFKGGTTLRVFQIRPAAGEGHSAIEAAQATALDVPFSPARARALAPGSEVVIAGHGLTSYDAGLAFGLGIVQAPGPDAGTFAGVGGAATTSERVQIHIRRRAGDTVDVEVSRQDEAGESLGLFAGFSAVFASPQAGGDDEPPWGSTFADIVRPMLNIDLSSCLAASVVDAQREGRRDRYRLDLSDPGQQRVYEALLRLDLTDARNYAIVSSGPLAQDRTIDEAQGRQQIAQATVVGFPFARRARAQELTTGTYDWLERDALPPGFETSAGRAVTRQGAVDFVRATRTLNESGALTRFFSGNTTRLQELLYTKDRRREASPPEVHYRHRWTTDTAQTTRNEMSQFLTLAKEFGFEDALGHIDRTRFVTPHGSTHRTFDVIWTNPGIESIVRNARDIDRVFGEVYQAWDEPGVGQAIFKASPAPWLATDHPEYRNIMSLLHQGVDPLTLTYDRYGWLTGRNLYLDAGAFKELQSLKRHLGALARAPSRDWPRLLVELDDTEHLGMRSLIALSRLAGRENTIINDLSLSGKGLPAIGLRDPSRLDELEPNTPLLTPIGLQPRALRRFAARPAVAANEHRPA
ncbi:MAG: hypothetical protein IPK13_22615 [Deltaproteobacteria bacterium]|nr:hypothetical protein [Deltaproteobacteria bacterium]